MGPNASAMYFCGQLKHVSSVSQTSSSSLVHSVMASLSASVRRDLPASSALLTLLTSSSLFWSNLYWVCTGTIAVALQLKRRYFWRGGTLHTCICLSCDLELPYFSPNATAIPPPSAGMLVFLFQYGKFGVYITDSQAWRFLTRVHFSSLSFLGECTVEK